MKRRRGGRKSGLRRKVSESKLPSTVRPTLLLPPRSERIQGAGTGRPSGVVLVELLVVFSLPDQVYCKSRVDSRWNPDFHHHDFSGPTIFKYLSMSLCRLTLCITLVFPHKNILPSLLPSASATSPPPPVCARNLLVARPEPRS